MSNTMAENRDPRAEALFLGWNIEFESADFELDDIRRLDGAQVREVAHIAPSEGVEEYATQMKGDAVFPPLVLMHPNILIDGNTRLAAARSIGLESFPAYILRVPSIDMALAVAGALNQLNGRRLDPSEAQRVALTMMRELHFTDEQVAGNVGRSAQMVRIWRLQADTEARADRLGLDIGQVSGYQRERLGVISHDPAFTELAKLANNTRIRKPDFNRLIREVKGATSDADALERIARLKTELPTMGPEPRGMHVNHQAQRARMLIPQLLNLDILAVYDAPRADSDRELWQKLADHTAAILNTFTTMTSPNAA